MDSAGLRRRRGASDDASAQAEAATTPVPASSVTTSTDPTSAPSAKQATLSSTAGSGPGTTVCPQHPPPPPPGTIAAAFRNAKGTELQTFVARLIAAEGFSTSSVQSDNKLFTVLLINLPLTSMIQAADELGLRKRDLDGVVRTFSKHQTSSFAEAPSSTTLFSQSERILLTNYCLDKLKPDRTKFDDVNGNESLLEWCKRQQYLEDVFPVHDKAAAVDLLKDLSFKRPTFDVGGISKIQDYFGDKVALYFAFLTFYTRLMGKYAAAGVIAFFLSVVWPKSGPLVLFGFSIFAALWGASVTSLWKRRNIEVVFMWKSLIMGDSADESLMAMSKKEDLKNEFYGEEVSHRITGERVVIFPKHKRYTMWIISTVVVLACLFVSCRAMLLALDFEDIMHGWLDENASKHKWSRPFIMQGLVLKNMPLVVYMGCLNVLDTLYGIIAVKLTNMENHKYHSTYENSHVLKLVLFQFLNMNMAYLYVAFVRRDYARLASSIRSILLTELVIGNVKETVLPIFLAKRRRKAKVAAAIAKVKAENPDIEDSDINITEDNVQDPLSEELELEPYEGVFQDYFELVRQFSQITLFAAAFPLGGLLALLNNFVEVYSDMYKMVYMQRRAPPKRALDIGAWIRAFEFVSIMSIMTNLGIITVTANYADKVVGKGISKSEEYFYMVVIEHGLLAARFAFMAMFEGIPSWVRDQRAKERFIASGKTPANGNAASPVPANANSNEGHTE